MLVERQKSLPVEYRGLRIECGYRVDLMVEHQVIVELKAVERILPVHEAQLLTYLRLSSLPVGLLLNFNVPLMKAGIKRLAHHAGDWAVR
jgi:GxxExxY protein